MSGKPHLTAQQRKAIKQTICEMLEKTPIIQSACQKVGISRMTFCRWRKKDKKFDKKIEEVLAVSRESINDLAESKMIQGINNGNASLIKLWLANNSSRYKRTFKEELRNPQPILFSVPPSPFMTGGIKKKKDP